MPPTVIVSVSVAPALLSPIVTCANGRTGASDAVVCPGAVPAMVGSGGVGGGGVIEPFVTKPLSVISNTVLAFPKVVPKRSPFASAIRPPIGSAPFVPLKLTSVVGVAGVAAGSLGDFEHRAVVVRAALFRRAEKVAVGVDDQRGQGKRAVGIVETDECGGRAGVAGRSLDNLEHGAASFRAAAVGRAEKVTVGVGNQAGEGLLAFVVEGVVDVEGVETDECGGRAGVAGGES